MTGVRNRLLIIIAVVAASVWAIYPPRDKLKLGLDLSGGVQLVLRVKTGNATAEDRRETVDQALRTIERRVNELGVSEPVVARYGSEDRILVELPGVGDVAHAKAIIKSTAQLRLTLVEGGPYAARDAALLSRAAYGPP